MINSFRYFSRHLFQVSSEKSFTNYSRFWFCFQEMFPEIIIYWWIVRRIFEKATNFSKILRIICQRFLSLIPSWISLDILQKKKNALHDSYRKYLERLFQKFLWKIKIKVFVKIIVNILKTVLGEHLVFRKKLFPELC